MPKEEMWDESKKPNELELVEMASMMKTEIKDCDVSKYTISENATATNPYCTRVSF